MEFWNKMNNVTMGIQYQRTGALTVNISVQIITQIASIYLKTIVKEVII